MEHTHVGKMIKSLKIKKLTHHYRLVCTSIRRLFVYSLVAISCVVICTSPFWIPCLCLSCKDFLFTSLPNFISLFLTPKSLFLLGNLIVVFLVGESKILCSSTSSSPTMKMIAPPQRPSSILIGSSSQEKSSGVEEERNIAAKEGEEEHEYCMEWEEEEMVVSLVDEDLRKRADDFIAKVNKQIRIEYHGDVPF